MTRVLIGVMFSIAAALVLAAVALAGYALWTEPARSAAGLVAAAGITILAQRAVRWSTIAYASILWLLVVAAYGLYLTGVPAGECIAAAGALVAVVTIFGFVAYAVQPPDD